MKNIKAYCEKEKVHEILRYAEACSLRDYLILRVLWESGLRVSELAALTPGDLEPHNQVINVINGKGNKSRRAYVDSGTMDMLCSYILSANIPEDCVIFGVFSTINLRYSDIYLNIDAVTSKYKLEYYT